MWPVHSLNDVVDINILSSIWSIYLINNIVLSISQNSLFFFYKKIFCFTSKKENKKKIMIRTCEIKFSLLSVINFYRDLPPPISKQCRSSMSSTVWRWPRNLFFSWKWHQNNSYHAHLINLISYYNLFYSKWGDDWHTTTQ